METEFNKYMMVLGMTGFLYKMLEEFDQKEHPQMDNMEMPPGWKEYTKEFFGTLFEYNPEDHVRPIKHQRCAVIAPVEVFSINPAGKPLKRK